MIDRQALLSDLQGLLRRLEADLLERSDSAEVPEVGQTLRAEFEQAKEARRTAQNYEDWRSDYITQIAAAWVLSCVFARFLEDNRLVDPPKLAGPGNRLGRARDEHTMFFQDRQRATQTDREYLLNVFGELAKLPGAKEVFGGHNPVWELPNWLSGDAAGELLRFFQRIDAETGALAHDFTDPEWETRFLGDLYQDLSEAARKKYALKQTPDFVEEFILDRTLDPAIEEFGLEEFRVIDPACGSGHFLLDTFFRLLERWRKNEPSTNPRELAQRALDSIHGVDVNPYAVAIARFRLLLSAIRACDITRLAEAPGFHMNLVCGDSLLHGAPGGEQLSLGWRDVDHVYHAEDLPELRRILKPNHYHAVVANPPYITPRDDSLNLAYRERYTACHKQYSLAVPFMERVFTLARPSGYVGQITTNSFMKREFGSVLVEEFFPRIDLTHVIDAAGAYIPGHGTPTVIVFARQRRPATSVVRTVMGIRGEPRTPEDPARGLVWSEIVQYIDHPGSRGDFVSVVDTARDVLCKHPWNLSGGGAAELHRRICEGATKTLKSIVDVIGRTTHTAEDSAFYIPPHAANTLGLRAHVLPIVMGENLRDYELVPENCAVFPYDESTGKPLQLLPRQLIRYFWPMRTMLRNRRDFGKTVEERGLKWFEHSMFFSERFLNHLGIAYPDIASHNHFYLDRGRKLFDRTAPAVKLPTSSLEADYYALFAFLNSSTACFLMKQVAHQKQMTGGDGVRVEVRSKVPYAFSATRMKALPIPESFFAAGFRARLIELGKRVDGLFAERHTLTALNAIEASMKTAQPVKAVWRQFQTQIGRIRSEAVLLQEELDFTVYGMFGFAETSLLSSSTQWQGVPCDAGQRPFELISGENQEGFSVPEHVPSAWPEDLRGLWHQRVAAIRDSSDLQLLEDPHYKRRWIGRQGVFNLTRATDELMHAYENWLLNQLESCFDFDGRMNNREQPTAKIDTSLVSTARLTDVARQDTNFMQVGESYRDDPAFDVQRLIDELVTDESVPLLPVLRYKPSGLRKRAEWEKTWGLQRAEDAIDARTELPPDDPNHLTEIEADALKRREVGDVPVPPKYKSSDFQKPSYWRLRGKLDVPKERWVSFPYCEGEDGTPVIAWAGYDHLQLARAISAYYVDIQERLGGRDDPRLVPLLACLIELLPWLKQWHNEIDPEFGMAMGDYFEGFIQEEARQMGKTVEEVKAWQPPKKAGRRKKKIARRQ